MSSRDLAEIHRFAHELAVSPALFIAMVVLGQTHEITGPDVVNGIHAFGSAIHRGEFEGDVTIAAAMSRLRVEYPKPLEDRSVDIGPALLRLADAIAKQRDPYTREQIAEIFGVEDILPILRNGSADIVKIENASQGAN